MDIDTLAQQAGDVTGPTPAQLHAGRRRLDAAATRATNRVSAHHRSRRNVRIARRRWAFTALAGAAAATAVAVALPLGGAPSASAEEVLLVTAAAAGEQPDAAAGATHWYVGTEADFTDTEPFSSEIWFSRDQPTVVRDGALAAGYLNDGIKDPSQLRTDVLDTGEDGEVTTSTWLTGGGEVVTWDELDNLPTDPADLEALLRSNVAGAQAGEDNELWATIEGLLASPASPALRQALWEVAARIPDVQVAGEMTDATGRQGTAIVRNVGDTPDSGTFYIVDPDTGAMLEQQQRDADGTVVYRATVLTQEPTESVPDPDAPLCGPGSEPERSC